MTNENLAHVGLWLMWGINTGWIYGRRAADDSLLQRFSDAVHPWMPLVYIAMYGCAAYDAGWIGKIIWMGLIAWNVWYWLRADRNDDERKKRRKRRSAARVSRAGHRLVVIPSAAQ